MGRSRDLGGAPATGSRVLGRLGPNRIAALEPAEPVRRYERERQVVSPGELIHIDIEKLGRFERTGQGSRRGIVWEYLLYLAVDDHSRLAFSQILPAEKRGSCLSLLFNALRFFRRYGVKVERVMTDNGSPFKSRRYARALHLPGIRHKRMRSYTPRTDDEAGRFVQTSLREWAYAKACETSEQRRSELAAFLFRCNWQRPHTSLKAKPPVNRIGLSQHNLSSLHT